MRGLPVGGWVSLQQEQLGRRLDMEDEAARFTAGADQGSSVRFYRRLAQMCGCLGPLERQRVIYDLLPAQRHGARNSDDLTSSIRLRALGVRASFTAMILECRKLIPARRAPNRAAGCPAM